MRLSDIGEFGLIERLAREFGIAYPPSRGGNKQPGFIVGLGDDAAVSERHDGYLVATTDTMVAGVHFRPDGDRWADAGWKALAVNVSDVAAMGAVPDAALVTLGLPDETCIDDIVALYRGLHEACDAFSVALAGGDIVRSPVFFITVAVNGWATVSPEGRPRLMTRHSAKAEDRVCLTGTVGDAAGGLRLLENGSPDDGLVAAQLRPKPPVAVGPIAAAAGVRCAIDLSDGLVQDLGHVARASGLGFRLEAARLPLSEALRRRFPTEAVSLALGGGEDYQLALVAPESIVDALRQKIDLPLTDIGEATAGPPQVEVIGLDGQPLVPAMSGWDHFRS